MKKTMMFSVAALLAAPAVLFSGSAAAAEAASHTTLKNCVIQEVVPGKDMTGAYVTFVHTGAPVNLKGAEVPDISQRVELHNMVMNNGVMEMGPLKDLTLNDGERVFKKGGDHVMLFDVKQKPAIGSKHTLTVFFDDGSQASCGEVGEGCDEGCRHVRAWTSWQAWPSQGRPPQGWSPRRQEALIARCRDAGTFGGAVSGWCSETGGRRAGLIRGRSFSG